MRATLRARAQAEIALRQGFCVPPEEDGPSPFGAISTQRASATLAANMASDRAEGAAPKPRNLDLRVDAAIAVVVFAVSLVLLAAGDTDLGEAAGDVDVLGVALTALASLPLVARRVAPLRVFVLTGLASAVLRVVAAPAGPPVGPTVALYGVAAGADESRTVPRLTFLVVATVFAAHLTATGLATDALPLTEGLLGGVVWGGAWLAGERTRLRQERMAELEERAGRAEREAERDRRLAAAEERMRIARDLHDSAGHAINVILVHAGLGRLRAERDPAGAREALETIEAVARETVGEIDQLVGVLREDQDRHDRVEPPPGLAAVAGLIERQRAAGLEVATTFAGERRPLPAGIDRAAYRILQEALTNAARHGDGSADVNVAFGERALELTVVNRLRDHGAVRRVDGHGIIGMRERATQLGGSLRVGARDGCFEVHAHLPFAPDPA
jgi:signal transduction histidine kinase